MTDLEREIDPENRHRFPGDYADLQQEDLFDDEPSLAELEDGNG